MITYDIVKHTKLMNISLVNFIYNLEYHIYVIFCNDKHCTDTYFLDILNEDRINYLCTQIGLLNNGIFLPVFLERTIFASIIFTYADIIISIDKRNWRFNGLKKIQLTMSIMLLYYGRYLHPQFRLLAVRKNML